MLIARARRIGAPGAPSHPQTYYVHTLLPARRTPPALQPAHPPPRAAKARPLNPAVPARLAARPAPRPPARHHAQQKHAHSGTPSPVKPRRACSPCSPPALHTPRSAALHDA
ncbi:hypothetical protein C8R43DRAFT_1118032 [Mycena crocata]|nr:hypothetical protein C8R43DRAFT_1118032 [Mycena crocata]